MVDLQSERNIGDCNSKTWMPWISGNGAPIRIEVLQVDIVTDFQFFIDLPGAVLSQVDSLFFVCGNNILLGGSLIACKTLP